MPSVLITAFEPYGPWKSNASWLCLQALTRHLPSEPKLTTRLYPVDFTAVRQRLEEDLQAGYDVALHLGQAPDSGALRLEQFAINVGGEPRQPCEAFGRLETDGPAAYRTELPLADWALALRGDQIPTVISHHAGTYLCNATLYWSHYLAERSGLKTQATFIHLPLETSQVAAEAADRACLPAEVTARALQQILARIQQAGGSAALAINVAGKMSARERT